MRLLRRLISMMFGREKRKAQPKQKPGPCQAASSSSGRDSAPVLDGQRGRKHQSVENKSTDISEPPEKHDLHAVESQQREPGNFQRPIVVGLDFGTHSTKVLIRARGEAKADAPLLDEPAANYPPFALPSLVRVVGNRLFFGRQAIPERGGLLFRSMKVRLLDDEPPPAPEGGPRLDLLVASYLGWVLTHIKRELAQRESPPLILNLAAPMNHLENARLKDRYLRIVHAAWGAIYAGPRASVSQGAELSELSMLFEPLLSSTVPPLAERRFDVLPETVAPMVSMSGDPHMEPGMYMVVDMGAGTTEISVDYLCEPGADQHVLCYYDESSPLGANNFEWASEQSAGNLEKEHFEHEKLIEILRKNLYRVWGHGYQKDGANPVARQRWRELTVLLAGGGARRASVADAIKAAGVHRTWPIGQLDYRVKWHRPSDVILPREVREKASKDVPLLAVAHGLTVERQTWPVVFAPGDIEQLPRSALPTPPSPYWYVR